MRRYFPDRSLFSYLTGSVSTTIKIIIVNVLVFILVRITASFYPAILDFLSLKPSLIIHGKALWTLLTSVFMHAGFMHLFFNMLSLWFIGAFVERIIGRKRFFWFYIIAGIIAGLFFALLAGLFGYGIGEKIFGSPDVSGVGASGAIFGLLGLLAVLTPKNKVYLIVGPLIAIILQSLSDFLIQDAALLGVISFILSIYIIISMFSIFSFNPRFIRVSLPLETPFWFLPFIAIIPLVIIGLFVPLPIGNTAHFGGLIAGLIYGVYLRRKYRRKVALLSRHFR